MERLPFTLSDFTRIAWTSDVARAVWEPRIQKISTAWEQIEWRSIVSGIRQCAVTTCGPEHYISSGRNWAKHGLTAMPMELQGLSKSYASTKVETELGKPFAFRVVIATPQALSGFLEAWETANDLEIANYLGYPRCCAEFF